MTLRFLRGNPDAPKGHAIFFARSTQDPGTIYCTYCVVPPLPLSLAKYLPPILAAQLPPEEIGNAANVNVMPIPPMLEEGNSLDYLQVLAENRDDDLCDLGSINPRDEGIRLQLVAESCQEYGQLYLSFSTTFNKGTSPYSGPLSGLLQTEYAIPLDDLDPDELMFQTMTERERLTELGKLIGTARYALEGHDTPLLQETKQRMQRIAKLLADKYRGTEFIAAATDPSERGARLAELYLERGFKLLDEEYADIPRIERAIRDLQN